jgi:hypothetical protein
VPKAKKWKHHENVIDSELPELGEEIFLTTLSKIAQTQYGT